MEELLELINISDKNDYLLTGIQLLKEMKIDKSIEFFDIAIENDKRCIDAYFNKGLALILSQEYDKAKEMFKACTIIDNKFGKAYLCIGDLEFYIYRRTEKALENYNKAIINNYDEELVHLNKGYIYISIKDYMSAIKSFNKALIKNPTSKNAILGKLEIYFFQYKFREAENCIYQLRQLDPECNEYYVWGPIISIAQDKEEEAIKILEEADAILGFNEEVAFSRIKVYEKINKLEDAINYIENIKDKLKINEDIYYKFMNKMVSYYLILENNFEAKKILKELSETYGNNEIDFKLANLYISENKIENALEYFDKILDRDPDNEYFITTIYMKAICNDRLGRLDISRELFEEALLLIKSACLSDYTNIDLLNMKSLCLYKLEKYDEAELCIKKTLKLEPKEINTLLIGAKNSLKTGELSLYKERIDKIIKLEPKYKDTIDEELSTL